MSTFTVSAWVASSEFSGAFAATKAGDGYVTTNNRWASADTATRPQWLRADLGSAAAANWYTVAVIGGNEPTAWTFEGSNDTTSWTTLDTRSGVTWSGFNSKTFTFTNTTAYRYYRLSVTVPTSSFISVAELQVGSGNPPSRIHDLQSSVSGVSGSFTLGMVFRPDQNGTITHLSYFNYPASGVVTLWLYDTARNVLGTVTHDPTGVPASWVEVPLATPVSVTSGTNYMVAAYMPGQSAYTGFSMSANRTSGDLTIPANGSATFDGATGNARYSAGNAFPTTTNALAFAVDVIFQRATAPTGVTGSLAGTAPVGVGSVSGTVTLAGTVAGTSPVGEGSLTGSVPPPPVTGSVAGTSPAGVSSLTGSAPTTGTVAGTSPSGVGSLTGSTSSTTTGSVAGTSPAGVGSLTGTVTSPTTTGTIGGTSPAGAGSLVGDTGTTALEPWTDGAHGEALLFLDVPVGVLEVTYPAAPAPPNIVEVALQRASHRMPALTGVRNMDYEIVTDVVGVPHVWVDGVDVTYFRDVPTKIGSPRQESPHAWTGATLTFPKVFHYEEDGVGELAWMRADAPVEIAIVRPDGSRIHRFTGQLTSDDPGTGRGRTESVWGVEGLLWQASHAHHPVPARLDPTDSGLLVTKELNGTPSRRFAPIPRTLTGDKIRNRGSRSQNRWDYVTEVLSTAVREDGKQWTIQPTGPRSFALALKDTTTVNWTITAGAPGVELDLSKDNHERIDAVYASGVGPDGYAWCNEFFPDLLPYDPPDYPFSDPNHMYGLGTRDSDTLTGDGITMWQRRIRDLGYTAIAVDGVMGDSDIAAVRWIQRRLGIQDDGVPGPQTWAATWNVGAVGGDLSTVRLPMAWRTEVEPYLYGANGAVIGKNPAYDPSIIRHEVDVDFGAGVTKEQGREMAQRILERGMDPGIAGTIRLSTCPWEGSRWEVNAGDNVLLKGYRGEDVLMRVAAVDPDFDSLTVTLTVDSEFRDAMAVMQVLERNRESKADPARRPGNPTRRSRLDQDQATPFEGESPAGRIPRMALFGGLWTVWPVPVSEVGIVSKLRFQTSGPASKFYLAAFGKPVTANQIAAKVPNPGAKTNPWEDAGEAWLESVAWIEGWGEQGSAAGYGLLGSEADGSPVTGELIDEAGFPYVSQVAPWVWVAMWAPVACYIEGRIFPDPVQ